MSHRRKESDATQCNDPSEFQDLLQRARVHSRLILNKFQQFWYFADRPTKMNLAKDFMRTKQILIVITSLLFISGTIWFGSHNDVHPSLPEHHRVIVMPTVPYKPFPDNDRMLRMFGLEDSSQVTKPIEDTSIEDLMNEYYWELDLPSWANTNKPAIVTAIFKYEDFERQLKMIYTVQQFAPNNHLVIFDMTDEKKARKAAGKFSNRNTVEVYCNLTRVCSVQESKPFSFSDIPKYIHKEAFGAYKPIFVQKVLKEFPMVLWLDSDGLIPVTGLEAVWNLTQRINITTWQIMNRCAASSYTFKKMLPYFALRLEDLHFSHMIESGSYAFKRTPRINHLIRLWLNCSLTEACIKPVGCDSRDCPKLSCQDAQPRFDYMGCHKYETSALSAALIKLNFHGYDALHDDYPFGESNVKNQGDIGYNLTAVQYNISLEKSRSESILRIRNVNLIP